MIKQWRVTAELNWDASWHDIVTVSANTQSKAVKFAYKKLMQKYPSLSQNRIIIREAVLLGKK